MSVDIYPCDDFDASMQLSNIEKAIENGANAIIIVPINDPCISKKIRQLNKDNIPVVFLTAYLNRIAPLSSIHCDYYRSGRIGARLLQLISGGNGHVMAFFPSSAMFGNNSRKQGFESYFTEASTTLSLTGVIELTNNPVKNLSLVREELTIHPEVDHIIFNGDSSIALSVLTELDRPVKAVFYDFSAETKNLTFH
jgi:LacI family transcriptional regulator